jgi:hypothetical protein
MELYSKYEGLNDTNTGAKRRASRKIVTFAGGRTLMFGLTPAKKGNKACLETTYIPRAQNESTNFNVARFTVGFRFTLGAMAGLPHTRDSEDARWKTQPLSTRTQDAGWQA